MSFDASSFCVSLQISPHIVLFIFLGFISHSNQTGWGLSKLLPLQRNPEDSILATIVAARGQSREESHGVLAGRIKRIGEGVEGQALGTSCVYIMLSHIYPYRIFLPP